LSKIRPLAIKEIHKSFMLLTSGVAIPLMTYLRDFFNTSTKDIHSNILPFCR